MMSAGRSRPASVMLSGVDDPIERAQPVGGLRHGGPPFSVSISSGVRSAGSRCLASRPVGVCGSSATTS